LRPTIHEQLTGICRILEDVVQPALSTSYPKHVLSGLVSNIRMLSDALLEIPGFLSWDNDACLAILGDLRGVVRGGLLAAIQEEIDRPSPDSCDWPALDARNERLRELLSLAVRSNGLEEKELKRITQHLAERAARNPIRFAIVLPKATKQSEGS
jgi:hypothetical protein